MNAYRLVYRLIYRAGKSRTIAVGAGVIIGLVSLGGGALGDAIPYGTLWVIVGATCRFLFVALPSPRGPAARFQPKSRHPKPCSPSALPRPARRASVRVTTQWSTA